MKFGRKRKLDYPPSTLGTDSGMADDMFELMIDNRINAALKEYGVPSLITADGARTKIGDLLGSDSTTSPNSKEVVHTSISREIGLVGHIKLSMLFASYNNTPPPMQNYPHATQLKEGSSRLGCCNELQLLTSSGLLF